MGKAKKTRKFAAVKRMLNPKDLKCVGPVRHPPLPPLCRPRLQPRPLSRTRRPPAEKQPKKEEVRHVEKQSAALFFKYNTQLGPPYQVLVDTNFINFSIKNKASGCRGSGPAGGAAAAPPGRPPPAGSEPCRPRGLIAG